jgi:hypothetical protein
VEVEGPPVVGDVDRAVRTKGRAVGTAEQIRQLKRRIGNPQMSLLIEAMNSACTKPPEEPDPFV